MNDKSGSDAGCFETKIGQSRGLITKKILRLSYDVIITYDNRKSNLRYVKMLLIAKTSYKMFL